MNIHDVINVNLTILGECPQQEAQCYKLCVSFVSSVNETQFVLCVIGKGIRRHDLCSKDIYL